MALHAPEGLLRFIAHIADSPDGIFTEAIALNRAQSPADTLADAAADALLIHVAGSPRVGALLLVPGDDAAPAWNQVHQPLESSLDFLKATVNIGVVELDGGQDQPSGK